jgi:hypothetical protein
MSFYQKPSSILLKSLTSRQSHRSAAVVALAASGTSFNATIHHHPATTFDGTIRHKHSSRQIKRLFKNNPAKRRVDNKTRNSIILQEGREEEKEEKEHSTNIPLAQFAPVLLNVPTTLPNGWNPPPSEDIRKTLPEYPFRVSRTRNKPNNAVGFLPVYSEFR